MTQGGGGDPTRCRRTGRQERNAAGAENERGDPAGRHPLPGRQAEERNEQAAAGRQREEAGGRCRTAVAVAGGRW